MHYFTLLYYPDGPGRAGAGRGGRAARCIWMRAAAANSARRDAGTPPLCLDAPLPQKKAVSRGLSPPGGRKLSLPRLRLPLSPL